MRITKEERRRIGQVKLDGLIRNAKSGDYICAATKDVRDKVNADYDCVRWEAAIYQGSLPVADRIPMFKLYKV